MNEDRNPSAETPPDVTTSQAAAGPAPGEVAGAGKKGIRVLSDQALGCFALLVFWLVVILPAASIFSVPARRFLYHWWWAIGVGVIVFPTLVWSIGLLKSWYPKAAESARTGVIVFVVLPLLIVGFGAIFLIPPDYEHYRITVVRSVFLVAVCLLPAMLYYLFIAARRFSLLNDYFVNLERLGLLQERPGLSTDLAKSERRVRLGYYVQKFEALYGPVPRNLREAMLDWHEGPLAVLAMPATATYDKKPIWDSGSSGSLPIFNADTAIPVVLATILVAIGWLMALPPIGFEKVQQETTTSQASREKGEKSSPTPGLASPTPAPTPEQGNKQLSPTPAFWSVAFQVTSDSIIYAFLGAYFFSLQMLFRRYVREDLRKAAYLAVSLRIVLAVIGTWAAIAAMKAIWEGIGKEWLLVVGFVIGVFPRIAWQFVQGAWK